METINNANEILTQNELAAALQEKGFDAANARLLAEWRRKDLLPAFDSIGGGRGKGQGRSENGWRNAETIIEQAAWVLRLRELYPTLDELYFPLWVLDYDIPNERVREALSQPLDSIIESFNEMVAEFRALLEPDVNRANGHIEDVINHLIHTSPFTNDFAKAGKFQMPPETIEAGLNIVFNHEYELNSFGFRDGLVGLQQWTAQNRNAPRLLQSGENGALSFENDNNLIAIDEDNFIEFIFRNALFLNENLSLLKVHEAVENCTDDDLLELRRDMRAAVAVTNSLGEMMRVFMTAAPNKFELQSSDAFLSVLFSMAKLVAWIDLALRQRGYAEIINYVRRELPSKIQQDLTDEKKREMVRASPLFVKALEEQLAKLEKTFEDLALAK